MYFFLCASVVNNLEVLKHLAAGNYTLRFDIVQKSLWTSCHFGTGDYTWRLDIVQSFFCLTFLGHFVPKDILEKI